MNCMMNYEKVCLIQTEFHWILIFLRSRQRHCGNMSGGNQQIATSVLRYAIELGVDDIMRIAITIFL